MGLDMYLTAKVRTYRTYGDEKASPLREALEAAALAAGLGASDNIDAIELSRECGYWRKANAIHGWFVDNVQGGKDECQPSYVSREYLAKLRDLCAGLLERQDEAEALEKLPPKSGFFFGNTGVNEWYWHDLATTVAIIDKALKLPEEVGFEYQASW